MKDYSERLKISEQELQVCVSTLKHLHSLLSKAIEKMCSWMKLLDRILLEKLYYVSIFCRESHMLLYDMKRFMYIYFMYIVLRDLSHIIPM